MRKDQINELKADLDTMVGNSSQLKAEKLYAKGWRKQSEGEWKSGKTMNGAWGYSCSLCGAAFVGENAEWIAKEHNYCPKCGAKMKGGE